MKNYEKYADEIREYRGTHFCKNFIEPYILKSDNCNGLYCGACHMRQMLWLLEDYEEPEVDWSKVAVDTPILVRNSEDNEWVKSHFARYDGTWVIAWYDGGTSWTCNSEHGVQRWKYAKLAETEGAE